MGWRDFVPDSIEDKVEHGVEKVGDAIEWAGDKTADLAEEVGLDDAGDWIRDKSRSAANQLGADVSELELGQTDDPKKLIYGSVSKIRAQVSHLDDFKAAFESVGNGLKAMTQPEGLKGKTADTFRETVAKEPPRWFKAADAFGKAADAMNRFAETVEWAQGKAKEALEEYEHAQKVSTDARNAHNKKVTAYKEAVEAKQDPLPPRPVDAKDFVDPGKALATAAQDKLDSARKQRNEVADTTAAAVRAARDAAPPKPSYAQQLGDGLDYLDLATTHLLGGVAKGTAGIANFARALNPLDPYNLTHPAEYLTSLNSTAAGLVTMANDPWGAGKQMLDEFMKDPSEGVGKLIPELVGSKGLGSLKKLGTAAKHVDDLKGPARAGHTADGPHMSETPDVVKRYDNTDPIDLATGRMFLPQTDVVLPGTLPLVFVRRAESGFTAGRWFGPTWTSTIDQHLEIDAEGAVLVTEDGLVVAYPHPAPGVPVAPLSTSAPRHPLGRTPDGDWTLTDPDTGHVRRFTPPANDPDGNGIAPIAQLEDRNGNVVTFEYDEHGTPLGLTHSAGHRLRFATHDRRITALHLDGGPRILAYGYTDGNLTEVTNSSGLPLRFAYDERARITSWTDTNNRSYTYEYDEQNRCIAEGGGDGHLVLNLAYDAVDEATGHRVTETVTGGGHTRRYLVDDRYRIVADLDPLGHTTHYVRDRHNRLLAQTDALGRTTAYGYDDDGRLVRVTRPDGRGTTARHNEFGLPVHVKRADGQVVRYAYDERGNRVATTDSMGRTTRLTYNEAGALTSVTDPLGHTTTIRCDRAGLPVEVTDPLGATTRFMRDAFGRPTAITDPTGAITQLEWTVEGRLARRVHADGASESWTWDGEGNCTGHTDRLGGITRFEYTEFDVLTARTGPDGIRHTFQYDAELRLTEVTNAQGLAWNYTYDAAGRLTSETDFDDRTVTYTYGPTGALASRTNALGQTTAFERNAIDQIIRKDAAGSVTSYAYDLTDQLAEAKGPDGTIVTLLRDREGRLLSETVGGRKLAYTYDDLGRRASRTTPTGATTTWSYDCAGRRTAVTSSGRPFAFTYDAAGREVTRRIGDSLVLSHAYDPTGRLTAQSVTGPAGARVRHRDYSYRADGHLTAVDDAAAGRYEYELDPAGRVTAVHAAGWNESYAYDHAGNQTFASWPPDHPGYEANGERAYEGNRLTRAGAVRYEHDGLGRVTMRRKSRPSRKPDVWRYVWDAEDRLVSASTPDGTQWRYLYDPLGRRTAKLRLAQDGESVAERIEFTWDGNTLCEQTTSSSQQPHVVAITWDHEDIRPIAQTERILDESREEVDSRFFAILTDLIGAPTELVDESGTVAWHSRSTLWGLTTWAANSTAYTPLRFPGQYADPETGLHYNYFRHYDPENARYLTSDPLGLTPAPNPFTYVANPHAWTDYLGLAPDYVPIYRTPKGAHAQYELDHGPNPANHQPGVDIGGGIISDGKIYFGERAVAAEYAGPTGANFAKGMVKYEMHPQFLEEFGDHVKVHDRNGPGGAVRLEFEIPVEKLDRFNELTQRRSWVDVFGGPS
ncbi:putative T7SS-secreted protein [Streptomyces sp. NPDC051109]|uniref:putative T7SS-secreted protein n=1 Tax=Streptomyces sp. NPDC051109 TaxID=3365642 RepID=UPI00378AAA6D